MGGSPRSECNGDDQEAETIGDRRRSTMLQVPTKKRPLAVSSLDNFLDLGAAFSIAPGKRGSTMRTSARKR